ncbi:MAG: hypothetical protein IPH54_20705 [Rhodoferax sp.]|nr:hypothetical protein [Rhodoferax sp.]
MNNMLTFVVRRKALDGLYSLAAVVHRMLCNEAPTPATIRAVNDSLLSLKVSRKRLRQFGLSYLKALWRPLTQP